MLFKWKFYLNTNKNNSVDKFNFYSDEMFISKKYFVEHELKLIYQ